MIVNSRNIYEMKFLTSSIFQVVLQFENSQFSRLNCHFMFSLNLAPLRNKLKLAAVARESQGEHPRKNQSQTPLFLESTRTMLLRCQRILKGEWQSHCLRSSVEQGAEFCVLCQNWINSFWAHKSGCIPELLQEHPAILTQENQEPKEDLS